MDEQNKTSQAQSFTIPQRYDLREHLYATRTSEAFRAVERDTGEHFVLWVLRHPLAEHSAGLDLFKNRLEHLSALNLQMPDIRSYGIDSSGKPFVVTELVRGTILTESTNNAVVAANYFLEAAQIVSQLHQVGIVLGDITEDSFLVTTDGKVQLIALMGTYEVDAAKTALLPKSDTLNFLSPEQKTGGQPQTACDVYAIGMVGYRLFAGRYPGLSEGAIDPTASPAPSMLNNELPLWVDDVIGSCLVERRDGRYRDASHIADTIQKSIESGLAPGGIGCWSKRTVMVHPDTVGKIRSAVSTTVQTSVPNRRNYEAPEMESLEVDAPPVVKGANLFIWLGSLSFVVGVIITAVIYFLVAHTDPTPTGLNDQWAKLFAAAPPDLKKLGNDFITTDASLTQRGDVLKRIAQREEEVAFAMVIEALRSAPEPQLRVVAGEALLQKIRASGYERSADILSSWFAQDRQSMRKPAERQGFDLLLNACNARLPVDRRRVNLSRSYTKQPALAMQLAAALALDSEDPEDFTPVLQQLLSVELDRDDLRTKSAAALILTYKPLSLMFNKDLKDFVKLMKPSELAWAMLELAKRNSVLVFQLAQETLDRQVVPPYQSVFLEALVGSVKNSLPSQVRIALIDGASNQLTAGDIGALGRWYSQSSEKPLLAVCAISESPELALLAFDTLAAKSIHEEPARSLIKWIKNRQWAQREKLVKAVGILGHAEIASMEEVNFAFDELMPHAGISLLDYIMKSKDISLLRVALDRFAELVSNDKLLSFLRHKDPDIRASAVRGLQGRNNLHVLQAVLRQYQREKDLRVRKLYRKYHFVVRDRGDR